ncbi:MAG: UDP-N-acetylmuramoyl-tripeptide--D-alanyl-D-alanine ligase [Spirochaetes bacterium]|nr:UDP-N-acetylmuramoyl-tripeptide--D-alanyl-D-alanine ligase [Spirochaetota bacterium]
MLNISIEEILRVTDGKLVQGENVIIDNFALDSRSIKKNEFFIALHGKNFDGHSYIVEAYKKGAIGALVDITKLNAVKSSFRKQGFSGLPSEFIIIKVENTLRSFGLIAAFYRRRYKVKTIAVTGSNGKTTTKELIYNLLLTKYKKSEILKTEKNYNNEIGVPLTIFKLDPEIKIFVAELGINHIGEMQRLAYMTDPFYGLITNIGETHLEFLKNDRIVAKAKGELIPYINNTLFFNFDDKYYNYFQNFSECKITGFSLNSDLKEHNVFTFDSVEDNGLKGYTISFRGEKIKFNLTGEHNLYNLLSALCVVDAFGININKAKKVIEKFKPLDDRGNFSKYKNLTIFFDAYNANPTSVKALLYFINNLNYTNRIAVLGDMAELGKKAMKHHTEVLNYISNMDFEKVFLYGKYFSRVYRERLTDKKLFKPYKDLETIGKELKSLGKRSEETIVIIKGSRKMEMEKLLKFIR